MKKRDWIENRRLMRDVAHRALSSLSPPAETAQPTEVMLHELLVHKVELEMQIEELQRTHTALEEARDHYAEYYEAAPVGYLTLGRDGLIREVNLTGAAMLGVDRAALIQRRLATFVSPRDGDRWHRLLLDLMEHPETERQSLVLEMTRAGGATFSAYLDCRRKESTEGTPTLRLALFDISQIPST